MRIHIALVGGQPIPVYLGIKSSGALDKLILVCSEQTRDEADRLAVCCRNIQHEIVVCDPVDLQEIEECAKKIFEDISSEDITLNLTSGTKSWSLIFYRIFMASPNAHFILVDQNNRVQDLSTHEVKQESIAKELRFLLYGTELTKYTAFKEYTDDDFKVMRNVENVRRKNFGAFKKLTVGIRPESQKGQSEQLSDGSYIEWNLEDELVHLCMFNRNMGELQDFYFQSPHVMDIVFNSGWFELKTALELSKNEHVKEICMNCEFPARDKKPKNEIDIILDMGNKLFFVECKTQVHEITDIDKFHSAIKNFSGTSSKGIFVVNDPPSIKKGNYTRAVEKCKDNNILTFNFSEYRNNPDLLSLNMLINEDLNKTNKR